MFLRPVTADACSARADLHPTRAQPVESAIDQEAVAIERCSRHGERLPTRAEGGRGGRLQLVECATPAELQIGGERRLRAEPCLRPHAQCREMHVAVAAMDRSEEHTSELHSLMRISYAVFCLKKKKLQLSHR